MAEFVSLVSGAATLVTLGSKCVQGLDTLIKAVRYGTDELAALSNEVSDLEFLFTRIRLAREDIRSGMPLESSKYNIDDALLEHFALAKSKYLELQELINEVIVTSSNGTEKVDTIAWFRKRSSAKRIQQQLKARKRKIYELLDTSMASTTARVEVSLQGYHNMVAIGLGQLIDQGAMIQGILPQVLKSENALEHTTRRTLQEPPKPGESDENISSESCALIPGAQREDLTISTAPPSMRRKPSCGVECDCACHRGRRMRTPRILQNIIGNLFVGYVGLPYLSPKCNSFSCQKRSAPILTARYQFPFWFIAKVLFASFAPNVAGDPRFGLTVRNRVQPVIGKNIFEMARWGDTEGVKEMLDKGLAGVDDIRNLDGCSAIALAIAYERVDICKLLLSAKADPFMEDDTGL
ncbi:MAG: hypothetical protein M1833_006931 [Piccolia ochrophora]|nr:MAG: hypothetical protein M1833_006931 [Piccolia ochrophora]